MTIIDCEDCARLYEKFKAASRNLVRHDENTSRVIPLFRLFSAVDTKQ